MRAWLCWGRMICRSTGAVWQAVNIGKAPGTPNNLVPYRAGHGQLSGHCRGVVCQNYQCYGMWAPPRARRPPQGRGGGRGSEGGADARRRARQPRRRRAAAALRGETKAAAHRRRRLHSCPSARESQQRRGISTGLASSVNGQLSVCVSQPDACAVARQRKHLKQQDQCWLEVRHQ